MRRLAAALALLAAGSVAPAAPAGDGSAPARSGRASGTPAAAGDGGVLPAPGARASVAPAPAANGAAPPAAARRVALEPLRATAVSRALVEVVEEQLCAALPEASGAEVICPADVAAAAELARQAHLLGECTTEACLARVDRIRAAERRVTGALERVDGGLVLTLRVEAAGVPGPPVAERLPEDLDALVSRLPGVVKKLFAR